VMSNESQNDLIQRIEHQQLNALKK
jgi:hypothetical protein